MRHDFSAQFLRILPPETTFGGAWEALCDRLLREEFGTFGFLRLRSPDRGVDILHRPAKRAYQCKASEEGALGSIDADASCRSLATAWGARHTLVWSTYCFATNASYTGAGLEKINSKAAELGLAFDDIEFLGPEDWDCLCTKHFAAVKDRFDYRVTASEQQVIDAFRSARYYPEYVEKYSKEISHGRFSLVITNNRTPLEVEIPFSSELSVKNCLDVARELLGISLEWTSYHSLDTSTGPSLSITINQRAQPFSTKIKDLPIESGDKLELWIKLLWREGVERKGDDTEDVYLALYRRREGIGKTPLPIVDPQRRREETLRWSEERIQKMIWQGVRRLMQAPNPAPTADC